LCCSFCLDHKWKRGYNPNKKSIFNVDDQQKAKVTNKTSDLQGQGHSGQSQGQTQIQIQQDSQLCNSQQQEEDDERG